MRYIMNIFVTSYHQDELGLLLRSFLVSLRKLSPFQTPAETPNPCWPYCGRLVKTYCISGHSFFFERTELTWLLILLIRVGIFSVAEGICSAGVSVAKSCLQEFN
ncbi:hypothetical protein PC121_g20457 [Phytophthora cactorum]|nr:hypothetical protein PC120_g21103 [Phytophthora cactorum]KAG3046787.1 hypothetical protein PC121_g20457 [Phytophthora cactorum]